MVWERAECRRNGKKKKGVCGGGGGGGVGGGKRSIHIYLSITLGTKESYLSVSKLTRKVSGFSSAKCVERRKSVMWTSPS